MAHLARLWRSRRQSRRRPLEETESLGPVINSVLGMLGGAGGMQLLAKLNLLGEGGLLSQIGGGAVGGTALMAVVGLLKKMFGGAKAK